MKRRNPVAGGNGVPRNDLLGGSIVAEPTTTALQIQKLIRRFGLSVSHARLVVELAGMGARS
jgi:hypothetical protein